MSETVPVEEVKPLIQSDSNGIIVKTIIIDVVDNAEKNTEAKQEVEENKSLLLELIELEYKGEKVIYPMTHLALQYMLQTDSFFKDANERIIFFRDLEVSYSRIIQDGHIDAKDVPELLNVTKKIYDKFVHNMIPEDKMNQFELIKTMLVMSMKIYLNMVNSSNADVLALFETIVINAIDLLKETQPLQLKTHKNKNWLSGLLCC